MRTGLKRIPGCKYLVKKKIGCFIFVRSVNPIGQYLRKNKINIRSKIHFALGVKNCAIESIVEKSILYTRARGVKHVKTFRRYAFLDRCAVRRFGRRGRDERNDGNDGVTRNDSSNVYVLSSRRKIRKKKTCLLPHNADRRI